MKFFPKCIHRSCYPRTKRRLLLNTFGGGILNFQRGKLFTCSVALRGGRGPAGRYRCVWGALAVFRPHWVCPGSPVCALPVYTAQALGCSIWSVPCLACGFSFGSSTKVRTQLRLRFVPSLAGAAQAARSLTGALSPGAAHLLPSAAPASVSPHVRLVSILLCLFLGAGL